MPALSIVRWRCVTLKERTALVLSLESVTSKVPIFARARFANQVSHTMYFCSAYITGCNLSYTNFERIIIEKCDLFENRWIGANLQGASFRESDLSRGVFSSDAWSQFRFQGADLCHVELEGLDPRRVDLTGVKICEWQQAQLLEPLGLIVMPA